MSHSDSEPVAKIPKKENPMCKFTDAKKLQADANAKRLEAIATLPEADAKQVTSVTPKAGAAGDKVKPSMLNKQGGFKITDEASKKKVNAGKTRRELSLNTKPGKKRVVTFVEKAKRIKTLVLSEVKRGKGRGDWNGTITFLVG